MITTISELSPSSIDKQKIGKKCFPLWWDSSIPLVSSFYYWVECYGTDVVHCVDPFTSW